jgi:hypothetical protein
MSFRHLKPGDTACRLFCGDQKQYWKVIGIREDLNLVEIGLGWTFDRDTGIEVDEDCPSVGSISRLIPIDRDDLKSG